MTTRRSAPAQCSLRRVSGRFFTALTPEVDSGRHVTATTNTNAFAGYAAPPRITTNGEKLMVGEKYSIRKQLESTGADFNEDGDFDSRSAGAEMDRYHLWASGMPDEAGTT